VLSIGLSAAEFLAVSTACGQVAGHYIGGATGLENGTAAPPGVYSTFFPVVEHINSLKGPNGNTVLPISINVVANMTAYAETVNHKVLGGYWGWSALFPVVNTQPARNRRRCDTAPTLPCRDRSPFEPVNKIVYWSRLFGGRLESVAFEHLGIRKNSALAHTMDAAGVAAAAVRNPRKSVAVALRGVIRCRSAAGGSGSGQIHTGLTMEMSVELENG
jgi:hypothetical protein